jgi:hypothetical protein
MNARRFIAAVVGAMLLVECSGVGNRGEPIPARSYDDRVQDGAVATGTVYDFESDKPLGGVAVLIASWKKNAPLHLVTVTSSDGTFRFSIGPGTYLLQLGSSRPPYNYALLHEQVTLHAGSNVIRGLKPTKEPQVHQRPAQHAGELRLMKLDPVQLACLNAAQQGRREKHLPLLEPDEYLDENAIADNDEKGAQNTAEPKPLFGYTQPLGNVWGLTTDPGGQVGTDPVKTEELNCTYWTGPDYSYIRGNPPYPWAASTNAIWYGADYEARAQNGGKGSWRNYTYGSQMWDDDPRP